MPGFGPVMSRAELQAERDMMKTIYDRTVDRVREGDSAEDMLEAGVLNGLARTWKDPQTFLHDVHKGLWAHHNKLSPMSSRAIRRCASSILRRALAVAGACSACALAAPRDAAARRSPIGSRPAIASAALAMIAAGADVNQAQPDGTTPLHWAAYRVDRELVAALLKKGARANVVNRYGASPLAEAVRVANVETGRDARSKPAPTPTSPTRTGRPR